MKWPPRYLQPLVKRLDRVRRGRRVCLRLRLRERVFALVFVNVASLVCVCMHVQGHLRVFFSLSPPVYMCVLCV